MIRSERRVPSRERRTDESDVSADAARGTIETGGGSSILVVPDGSRAYIGMTGADKVAVVDLGKLEVVSEIGTGEGPDGMAWVAGR
jgi:YVTN family beta-propeller protein